MIKISQTSIFLGLTLCFTLASCSGGDMVGGSNTYKTMKRPNKPGGPNSSDPNGNKQDNLETDSLGKTNLAKPKFAMMARDLRCGMCHLKINGDIVSTENVMSFEPDRSIEAPGSDDHIVSPFRLISMAGEYKEVINGSWFIKGTFPNDRSKTRMQLTVTEGIKENYSGVEIPPRGFPKLDLSATENLAKGTLETSSEKIEGVKIGNFVIDGSSTPFKINGEVLIKGDVVIRGTYTGQGTIYASGNIYIAGNIVPTTSAFPFSSSKEAAMQEGRSKTSSQQYDALALAAKSSIIIGNPRDRAVEITPKRSNPPVDAKNVFNWYPRGEGAYVSLISGKFGPTVKTTIEAFLYAENMIAGKIGNYVINGGLMCDSFHILGTTGTSGFNTNYVNYDYRFAGGLDVLQALNSGFTP